MILKSVSIMSCYFKFNFVVNKVNNLKFYLCTTPKFLCVWAMNYYSIFYKILYPLSIAFLTFKLSQF